MKVTQRHIITLELASNELLALRAMLHGETHRKLFTRLNKVSSEMRIDANASANTLLRIKAELDEI